MRISNFLRDKIFSIVFLTFAIVTIEIFLLAYRVGNFIKIYIPIVVLGLYFIALGMEYFCKKRFYETLLERMKDLDEKYLITEIIKTPNFWEGRILKEALEQVDKSMLENVNKYRYMTKDYKEYVELWIHEIKIPIAASKLVIENNKNEITKSIDEELDKVEDYVEQALFYARSNTVEKDYYIKKINLREIINESLKKNKSILIQERISINIHDLDVEVNTDSKWLVFILNQLIQNSCKYRKQIEETTIDIYSRVAKENVVLFFEDNGMGIKAGEITRVFEKGFTGTNGRKLNKKSTGIGLYLCKKLCNKLGISMELNSVYNEGTAVKIIFPKNSYMDIV